MPKRLFDITLSLIGLTFMLPLFAIIAILIKIDSQGPVFYKHRRVGKNFKPFGVYKFRTMVKDADKIGPQITSGGDPRITKIGRFLRKSKIDELPQLINVLKGDMSLVGPRPEVEKYVNLYKKDYQEILKVRPGITDISSVIYRDEEAVLKEQPNPDEYYKNILLPRKIQLAKKYVKNQSILLDLKIILATILKVIFPNHPVTSLMPEDTTNL